jgi:predicted transposase YbfD/YdcC
VFSLLDGRQFQERFIQWVQSVFRITRGQVIAIDGKTLRRSHHRQAGQEALQLVSAWATANGVVLGQWRVEVGSNEIGTIPALLESLFLKGCIVTIDAIGCQTDIAEQIVSQQADYVLALKANQARLYQDVVAWFEWARERQFGDVPHSYHQPVNKGHGRLEIRRCWALSDPHAFEMLGHHERWARLNSIVMVERERHLADQHQIDTAYFIASLPPDARRLLACTRHHWQVENRLHWSLDITFREDDAGLRVGDGAENFAILRRMALNLLKHHPAKASLKRKRFRAALDDALLLELLTHV